MTKPILCVIFLLVTHLVLPAQRSWAWKFMLSDHGKVLDLSGQNLRQVPTDQLDKDVEVLILDDNNIRDFPLFFPTYCPRLKVLSLRNNCLTQIPDRLGHSTGLQELYLDGNAIERLPASIVGLRFLTKLSLEHNLISDLSSVLKHLPQLEALYVGNNLLAEIPDEIGQLAELNALFAADNLLGKVSDALERCKKLRHLDLSYNHQLRRIPDGLGQCTSLRTLDLRRTSVFGPLKWIVDLPDLDVYHPPSKGVTTTKSP